MSCQTPGIGRHDIGMFHWYHKGYICNGKPILPHATLKPHLYSKLWWSTQHFRVSTQSKATKKQRKKKKNILKQKPRSADAIAVVFVEETEHSFCIFDLQTLSREPASRYRRSQPTWTLSGYSLMQSQQNSWSQLKWGEPLFTKRTKEQV